ncbi:MAG TPA: serine--tRNA ligase [Planctomycetota bacterium]|nr:serine--tRNA ligase [Planctomycetota bacterium]
MLDVRYIAEHADAVKKNAANKNERRADIDRVVALNDQKKKLQLSVEEARTKINAISKDIAALKKGDPKADVSAKQSESRAIGDRIKTSEEDMKALEKDLHALLQWIPNMVHESVPVGEDATSNRTQKTWGEKTKLGFTPRPHWEIGKDLGILDEERAAKLSGSNFLLLMGAGAALERALINFMLDLHIQKHGYKEVWPPFLVNRDSMIGTGQVPKMEDDMYKCEKDELFLIPTAEVPVTNLHRDEILTLQQLPIRYTSYTACFRREAGAYSKDTRGMQRIHQFDKVEMVKFTHPDTSWEELETLTVNAEEVLEKLGLHYRRLLLSTGDMSFASAKTYDLEAWAPGLDKWLEVSSCSNFTDFQARRLNTRFRDADGKVKHVHTLNGSGLALPRTVIAILENYQQADGSVVIPEALRSYLGGVSVLKK